jgi:hypothetical protein
MYYNRAYLGGRFVMSADKRTGAARIGNKTAAQQVRVEEINDRHELILHAGSKVISVIRATESRVRLWHWSRTPRGVDPTGTGLSSTGDVDDGERTLAQQKACESGEPEGSAPEA